MKKVLFSLFIITLSFVTSGLAQQKPEKMWFHYDNRFYADVETELSGCDSISFSGTAMSLTSSTSTSSKNFYYTTFKDKGHFQFYDSGRWLVQPSDKTCDFTKESSQWCFQRSKESEHFAIFWENGLTADKNGNITYDGYTCNINTLLSQAEKIWDCYINKLGFLVPGSSTTDNVKIEMFVVKKSWDGSDWRADGSGIDGTYYALSGTTTQSVAYKVGVFHCTTRAATARNGHTLAHEIGHTFQYLVSADLGSTHGLNYGFGEGASGGNEWWEDCANWQAYKVYPQYQYSDGEYYEQYLAKHHLNIHHENIRYTSCYYQDWWCQQHGMNTVGRVWREATKPEDPSEAYMSIFGLDVNGYAKEMYDAFSHLASVDIDAVRNYGKAKIGNEPQRLIEPSDAIVSKYLDGDKMWWVVDPNYCPQNFGYNANPLKVPAAGTVIKAQFKGIAGATGYRSVNVSKAGWRYGLVAYCSDGTRVYSDMMSDREGEVTMTVPEKCQNIWLVVMGAPTEYWRHAWDDDTSNDEQWPYAVKFNGTDALGASRTYTEFPEDYIRKDTTVVVNVNLTAANNWSYTPVRLDMDAISQALGATTAQLKAAVCGVKTTYPYVRIAGLNADKKTETNSKTISDSDVIFGHWFTSGGNVTNYGNDAYVYTKIYQDTYTCYVGQNAGKLQSGKTYIVREAVIYTHTDGKQYKAVMEIHLNAK